MGAAASATDGWLDERSLVHDRVAPTLMWGREGSGMHSRVELANYYSLLQPDAALSATAMIWLFSSSGEPVAFRTWTLRPLEHIHVPLRELVREFEGTIAVSLVPDRPLDHNHRFLGTLYFVSWFDDDGHVQFSHEQNRMTFERDPSTRTFLSPGLQLRDDISVSVIVQRNYYSTEPADLGDVEVTIQDRDGHAICTTAISPGPRSSERLSLEELGLPTTTASEVVSVKVRGRNLNHPFTLVDHVSGDFNVHHF